MCKRHDLIDEGCLEETTGELVHRIDAVIPIFSNCIARSARGDRLGGLRLGMKRGNPVRHLADAFADVLAGTHQRGEATTLGHATHDDKMIGGLAVNAENVGDAEVHVRSKSSVQLDLTLTCLQSTLPCRTVDEIHDDGLLEFVDLLSDEEQHGDMRFTYLGCELLTQRWIPNGRACRRRLCNASTTSTAGAHKSATARPAGGGGEWSKRR